MEFQVLIMNTRKTLPEFIKKYSICAAVLLISILSSCEEEINVDLLQANPVIVIDGSVSDQSEIQTVKLSSTSPFYQPNAFNGIKDARVTVYSSNSQTHIFTATSNGVYQSQQFKGLAGVNYTLEVVTGGKTYKASSIMPALVKPDSISFKSINIFGNSKVYPIVHYKDPVKIQNQYRYLITINGVRIAEQVSEDRFSDGNATSDLLTFDGDGVKSGDKVDIEMQCIDRNVFKYYFAISQIGGNGGPPVAPSNPDSNFDNGALGIFSANTRATYSVTMK